MTIGEKIQKAVEKKGFSQKEFSIMTKISEPKLSLMFTSKRRMKLEELEVICWALQTDANTFLTPKPPRK